MSCPYSSGYNNGRYTRENYCGGCSGGVSAARMYNSVERYCPGRDADPVVEGFCAPCSGPHAYSRLGKGYWNSPCIKVKPCVVDCWGIAVL